MRNLKTFENFNADDSEIPTEEKNRIKSEIQDFITESGLDAEVGVYEEDVVFTLKKSNKCFNSDSMGSQFSNDLSHESTGMAECGFMSDYTTIEDMYSQLRVIESISNSLGDIEGIRLNRIYSNGDSIIYEFYLDL